MKKLFLIPMLSVAMLSVAQDKGEAIVNQEQGKYIFMMCKPKAEYTFLGTVKIKAAWTGMGEEMVNIALKKVNKDYPQADAIIFTRLNLDQIDVIKFK